MANTLLGQAVGDLAVTNTVTETSLGTVTIPGGTLGTSGQIVVRLIGNVLNNTGAGATVRVRVKYGATTVFDWTSISLGSSANRYAIMEEIWICGAGATNSQICSMHQAQGGANSATGNYAGGNADYFASNLIAIDSTVNQTLDITVELSTASASLEFLRRGIWVEQQDTTQSGTGSQTIAQTVGDLAVVNTTTETTVFTTTIAANTLGTTRLLVIRLIADFLNDSGAGANTQYRVKYGGTTFFSGADPSLADDGPTNRYSQIITVWLGAANATNAQRCAIHNAVGASNSGAGTWSPGGTAADRFSTNAIAIDSTAAQTLEITVQNSVASAVVETRRRGVWVELIRAA